MHSRGHTALPHGLVMFCYAWLVLAIAHTALPHGPVMFCYAWLVLAIAERGIAQLGGERRLIGIAK